MTAFTAVEDAVQKRRSGSWDTPRLITVILGGLGSIKGTLVSALIMGQVISVGGTIWSPLAFVAPFAVMFVVILVKPTGLYGVTGKAFGFEA